MGDTSAADDKTGVARIARGVLRVSGGDRVRFLQGLVTHDVAALAPGQGQHAAMLSVKGRVMADLVVLADADALWLALPEAITAKVEALLNKHAIADDVEIERVPVVARVVVGPRAAEVVERAVTVTPPAQPFAHVWGANGQRVWLSQEYGRALEVWGEGDFAAAPLDEAALEILRVEAGQPRYGTDVSEDELPLEAGLDSAISFSKGCYLGQEVIARATARGHINRKLVGLRIAGDAVPAPGARLSGPGRDDAGRVTSVVRSPRLGPIALGYVHRTLWDEGTELTAEGGARVRVTALPFSRG